MFNYFEWMPFFAGLVFGIFLLFFLRYEKMTLYKYPHPNTIEKLVYRDQNGACYKYNVKEVNCDENESTLKEYPLQ